MEVDGLMEDGSDMMDDTESEGAEILLLGRAQQPPSWRCITFSSPHSYSSEFITALSLSKRVSIQWIEVSRLGKE